MEKIDDSLRPSSLDLSFSSVWVCRLNLLSCFRVGKLFIDYPLNRKKSFAEDHERKEPFNVTYFNDG